MLIWHRIGKDGKYNMRTNMILVQDINHLTNILIVKFPNLRIVDMSSITGNAGLWRVTDIDGEIIGEAYDPNVYRVFPGTDKEMVIPAYENFYDIDGKFSSDLFHANYKAA